MNFHQKLISTVKPSFVACLVLFLVLCGNSYEAQAKQWMIVYAKEGFFNGIIRQSFGHIFIGLVQEDRENKDQLLAGKWGFYPKGGIQKEGVWGSMDGTIRNDWNADFQDYFVFEISEKEFTECLLLINRWNEEDYSLRTKNCIHFIRNIISTLSGVVDPGGYYLLSTAYLSSLKKANKAKEARADFKQYTSLVQIQHFDSRIAKKFFVLTKWKRYFFEQRMKYRIKKMEKARLKNTKN